MQPVAEPRGPGTPECRLGADGIQACGYNCLLGADGRVACANTPDGVCALGSGGRAVCSQVAAPAFAFASSAPGPGPGPGPGVPPPPECKLGSRGDRTCGYNCLLGADGRVACANTPDGVCALGSDGRAVCSQVAASSGPGAPPPECKLGSHGDRTCGYNCRLGSSGHWYCASRSDANCALNADGSWSCP